MTIDDLTAAGYELTPAFDVEGVTVYHWSRGSDGGYLRADDAAGIDALLTPPPPPPPPSAPAPTLDDLAAAITNAATFADAQKAIAALDTTVPVPATTPPTIGGLT